MAKNLYFSRDSKLYVEFDGAVWQVPVLDGFSFSQSTNASEITLSEMQNSSGLSRRGRRVFTDSLAPAEWSFSTYVRPYLDNSQHSAVEAVLWALMAGADTYTGTEAGAIATLNGTITTNIDGGVAGTYVVTPTTNSVAGTGAVLQIVVTGSAPANMAAVTVLNPGTGYLAGDTLTVDGDLLGDTTGNFVVTIATVTPATRDFARVTNIDTNGSASGKVFTSGASNADLTFAQSNRSTLGTANFYFVMATDTAYPMVYKLTSAAINEASIDFEVDGIATINWSGNAATIVDMQSAGNVTVGGTPTAATDKVWINTTGGAYIFNVAVGSTPAWSAAIDTAVTSTNTFIRNRLTQLLVDSADTTTFPGVGSSGVYNMTITGGNITISNNITYLVPEELGKVNIPIEHVTGARSITGNFTCYLTFETTTGQNGGTSSDFFNDLTSSDGLKKVVNDFDVTFQIGGSTSSTPRLYVNIPKCHIEVPNHAIEDVIAIETNFSAYTTDFGVANEVSLQYYGVTV